MIAYVFPIDGAISINPQVECLTKLLNMGMTSGGMDVIVKYQEEKITAPQNSKSHAMMTDVRKQGIIKMPGRRIVLADYVSEEFKALVVIWFANEMAMYGTPLKKPPRYVTCPVTGEKITIRPSTTDFELLETKEFIEYLYSLGADSGVEWSEPALKEYENYRQA